MILSLENNRYVLLKRILIDSKYLLKFLKIIKTNWVIRRIFLDFENSPL